MKSTSDEGRTMHVDMTITRRAWFEAALKAAAGSAVLSMLTPSMARALPAPVRITIYKDPSCGCCTKWVTHLAANGFKADARDRSDMDALKDSLGVPSGLRSCHTAVVGKFVIEGHVPAADIRKLIAKPPKKVLGLAVPGMPAGSPGMEVGGRSDRYDVIAFTSAGKTHVFATHG